MEEKWARALSEDADCGLLVEIWRECSKHTAIKLRVKGAAWGTLVRLLKPACGLVF